MHPEEKFAQANFAGALIGAKLGKSVSEGAKKSLEEETTKQKFQVDQRGILSKINLIVDNFVLDAQIKQAKEEGKLDDSFSQSS